MALNPHRVRQHRSASTLSILFFHLVKCSCPQTTCTNYQGFIKISELKRPVPPPLLVSLTPILRARPFHKDRLGLCKDSREGGLWLHFLFSPCMYLNRCSGPFKPLGNISATLTFRRKRHLASIPQHVYMSVLSKPMRDTTPCDLNISPQIFQPAL